MTLSCEKGEIKIQLSVKEDVLKFLLFSSNASKYIYIKLLLYTKTTFKKITPSKSSNLI